MRPLRSVAPGRDPNPPRSPRARAARVDGAGELAELDALVRPLEVLHAEEAGRCAHCKDEDGQPVAYPCITITTVRASRRRAAARLSGRRWARPVRTSEQRRLLGEGFGAKWLDRLRRRERG